MTMQPVKGGGGCPEGKAGEDIRGGIVQKGKRPTLTIQALLTDR